MKFGRSFWNLSVNYEGENSFELGDKLVVTVSEDGRENVCDFGVVIGKCRDSSDYLVQVTAWEGKQLKRRGLVRANMTKGWNPRGGFDEIVREALE